MSARNRQRRIRQCGRQAIIDRLEPRWMLGAHSGTPWVIDGDRSGKPTDDTIVVYPGTKDSTKIVAKVNGKIVGVRARSKILGIQVNGLEGNDNVNIALGAAYADIPATVNCGGGNDSVQGGAGNDVLIAGSGNDTIDGGAGNDFIRGGRGKDLLIGGDGNDTIVAGSGNNTLVGGAGNDSLVSGPGRDMLFGGAGDDTLRGSGRNDTLRAGDGHDLLIAGRGRDVIYRKPGDRTRGNRNTRWRTDLRINPLVAVSNSSALKQRLIDSAVKQWQWAFGKDATVGRFPGANGSPVGLSGAAADQSGAPGHSETNNQVKGVDEADLVKTDGNYLYLLKDNNLIIMNSWPADQSKIVSRTPLTDWPDGMYLDGDRLTIISQKWQPLPMLAGGVASGGAASGSASDVRMMPIWGGWWSKPQTIITVYDVSDRAKPTVASQTTVDGSISSSRDINGKLYLVVDNSIDAPQPVLLGDSSSGTQVYESKAAYVARLQAMTVDELLPQYKTVITPAGGTPTTVTGSLVSDGDLWLPSGAADSSSMFTIALFDLKGDLTKPVASTSALGISGTVYASTDSIYVASQSWDAPMGDWQGDYRTNLYHFKISGSSIDLASTGAVPGWAVDQFAMDQNNGYFRIATTNQSDGLSNNIFVMRDQGDQLNVVGSLTNMATSERIYAARFVGDAAYLVTFRQVDPLFAIDLKDPKSPQRKGVLEMPGYSSYLHPIDSNHLIGFGRNADSSGRVKGLQVSLFDVSNLSDPKRIDVMQISDSNGWWSGSSAAEWDHHAFSYFPDQHVLALPVLDYGWWNNDAKLDVIKVDENSGFTKLGQIEHQGEVLRSVQIGDYLYSIGTDAVKVVAINDPAHEVADVALPQDTTPPQPVPLPLIM